MAGEKWRQHLDCVRQIRLHPGWTDEEVAEAVGLRMAELDIVREARREVQNEVQPRETSWERNY